MYKPVEPPVRYTVEYLNIEPGPIYFYPQRGTEHDLWLCTQWTSVLQEASFFSTQEEAEKWLALYFERFEIARELQEWFTVRRLVRRWIYEEEGT